MIKHYHVRQGSEEWLRLRMGRPTASEFERIITPKEWKRTKNEARRRYMIYLLTELMIGHPLATITTATMQHGHDWEPKARLAYSSITGADVLPAGFCTTDDGTAGASPDSFIGDDGSLEVKCPEKPEIHVGYMEDPDTLVQEHFVQTQGQLYVTGRAWTDLISYHHGFEMVRVRIIPNPVFVERLHEEVTAFCSEFLDKVIKFAEAGRIQRVPERLPEGWRELNAVDIVPPSGLLLEAAKPTPPQVGDFDLTDADVDRLWLATQPGATQ